LASAEVEAMITKTELTSRDVVSQRSGLGEGSAGDRRGWADRRGKTCCKKKPASA